MAMYLLQKHDPDKHDGPTPGRHRRVLHPLSARFRKTLREAFVPATSACLRLALVGHGRFVAGFLAAMVRVAVPGTVPGQQFLPGHRFGPDPDACARADGFAHRGYRRPVRPDRTAASTRCLPAGEVKAVIDNIGLPVSSINTVYNNSGTIGPQDGDIIITLKEGHAPTPSGRSRRLRRELPQKFAGTTFAFLPADITSQILNFGSPAPIDVQISGNKPKDVAAFAHSDPRRHFAYSRHCRHADPAARRARQTSNVDVNRTLIGQYGLERARCHPTAWPMRSPGRRRPRRCIYVNPATGIQYRGLSRRRPNTWCRRSTAWKTCRSAAPRSGTPTQLLGGVAKLKRSDIPAVLSQYNIAPVYDVFATTQNRDLGAVGVGHQRRA